MSTLNELSDWNIISKKIIFLLDREVHVFADLLIVVSRNLPSYRTMQKLLHVYCKIRTKVTKFSTCTTYKPFYEFPFAMNNTPVIRKKLIHKLKYMSKYISCCL